MKFKAKVFKLGHSKAIYLHKLPKEVYTDLELEKEYEFEVYTEREERKEKTASLVFPKKETPPQNPKEEKTEIISKPKRKFNTDPCSKHIGSMKGTCGCP